MLKRTSALLASLLLIASTGAGACRFEGGSRSWRFETAPGCELAVAAAVGNIRVEPGPAGEIVVRAEVIVRAPGKHAARRIASRIEFDVDSSPGRVSVRAVSPSVRKTGLFAGALGDRTSVAVHYRVTVPPRARLVLRTSAGDIAVLGVEGCFDVSTERGDIAAIDIAGRGAFRTRGGGIECRLSRLDPGGELSLRSFNGPVLLAVPDDLDARLEAEALAGRVRARIDLDATEQSGGRRVSGVIGDGGGRIVIRAKSGSIEIVPLRAPETA